MSDIWNARRAKLQAELARAALELAEHTGAEAFSIPIAGTTPAMVVSIGRAPDTTVAPTDEPLVTLILGGIDDGEYGDNDSEIISSVRIEEMQHRLVTTGDPVYIELYARQVGAPDAGRDARDGERLEWLEKCGNEFGLLLHVGNRDTRGYSGLGLSSTGRTLRQAIDAARGVKGAYALASDVAPIGYVNLETLDFAVGFLNNKVPNGYHAVSLAQEKAS